MMYKKSIKILKDNYKMILIIIAVSLLPIIGIIPINNAVFNNDFQQSIYNGSAMEASNIIIMIVSYIGIFFLSIAGMILVLPPLLNFAYEACQGDVEKGWYKRGLKRM